MFISTRGKQKDASMKFLSDSLSHAVQYFTHSSTMQTKQLILCFMLSVENFLADTIVSVLIIVILNFVHKIGLVNSLQPPVEVVPKVRGSYIR